MDLAAAALGFALGLVSFTLGFITLWTKVRNGIKAAAHEVLIESGLIKPNRSHNWPNGYDTLADALDELHEIVTEIRNSR